MKKIYSLLFLIFLGCGKEITPPQVNHTVTIQEVTVEGVNRNKLLEPIFRSMKSQEEEKLPFDEPRHENGRQFDGRLRPMWEAAYKARKPKYSFETDVYHTLGKNKIPLVPQVCADFIVDTIDRAAGTWYNSGLKNPKKVIGKLNFRGDMEKAKYNPRDVNSLMEYMKTQPENFEFLFDGDGPVVGNAENLKKLFVELDAQPGDLVFIKGYAPWDRGREIHYHSFFITKTGEEFKIFGNAAFPAEWSLEREVKRAPKRHVIAVIRLSNLLLSKL